jgi:hypothetical protein
LEPNTSLIAISFVDIIKIYGINSKHCTLVKKLTYEEEIFAIEVNSNNLVVVILLLNFYRYLKII